MILQPGRHGLLFAFKLLGSTGCVKPDKLLKPRRRQPKWQHVSLVPSAQACHASSSISITVLGPEAWRRLGYHHLEDLAESSERCEPGWRVAITCDLIYRMTYAAPSQATPPWSNGGCWLQRLHPGTMSSESMRCSSTVRTYSLESDSPPPLGTSYSLALVASATRLARAEVVHHHHPSRPPEQSVDGRHRSALWGLAEAKLVVWGEGFLLVGWLAF